MSPFDKDAQFLKSNAAAMRALAGGKEHQVTYAGTDTHVGNDDVRLPALPPTATAAQKASLRGAADGAAVRVAHRAAQAARVELVATKGDRAVGRRGLVALVEADGARHCFRSSHLKKKTRRAATKNFSRGRPVPADREDAAQARADARADAQAVRHHRRGHHA